MHRNPDCPWPGLPDIRWWQDAFTWPTDCDADLICQGYFIDSFKEHLEDNGCVQLVTLRCE